MIFQSYNNNISTSSVIPTPPPSSSTISHHASQVPPCTPCLPSANSPVQNSKRSNPSPTPNQLLKALPSSVPTTPQKGTKRPPPQTPRTMPSNHTAKRALAFLSPGISPTLPEDLGKCIRDDCKLLDELGWQAFVASKRDKGDIGPLAFPHPARRLLTHY